MDRKTRARKGGASLDCGCENRNITFPGLPIHFCRGWARDHYGAEPALVELAKSLRIRNNIIFLHEISDAKKISLLNSCTLLALPSLSEGLPTAILEAMSCGKPVVVTGGIGLEEVVADAGIFVPPADPAALAKAIECIFLNESLAHELGNRGRNRAVSRYDWHLIVSEVDRLYEGLLDEQTCDLR